MRRTQVALGPPSSASIRSTAPCRATRLLCTARPQPGRWAAAAAPLTTTTTVSATMRRLSVGGLVRSWPTRAGVPTRTGASPGRRYSTEAPAPDAIKAAETPGSLDALRAEFYEFQKRTLHWTIGGVPVPKPLLALLALDGFLALMLFKVRDDEMMKMLVYDEAFDSSLSLPSVQYGPSFTHRFSQMESTALYSVTYAAVVSAVALLWARRRTKRSFNSFILSRALGESTGTYPISLENVTRKGASLRIKSDGLKAVRKHVVHLAGLQAAQASLGLVLSSAVSSYAIKRWSDAKVLDDVIGRPRDGEPQRRMILLGVLLADFIAKWVLLVYQPFTIVPCIVADLLMQFFPLSKDQRLITLPYVQDLSKPVVTERTTVKEVDGGKEYITVKEKKTGSSVSRSETRIFISDTAGDLDRPLTKRRWSDQAETPETKAGNELIDNRAEA